jgi:predicted permease
MISDLRFAVRQLAKSPGFTGMAVLTLALGIGANATVFSFFNALVLRPVPAPEPARMVRVHSTMADRSAFGPLTHEDYVAYRDSLHSFDGLAASAPAGRLALAPAPTFSQGSHDATTDRVGATFVSTNYFGVLRASFALGRPFQPSDLSGGSLPVVISHRLWHDRFEADGNIVGRGVLLNGRLFTVAGVLAAGFKPVRYDDGGGVTDVWMPLEAEAILARRPPPLAPRTDAWLNLDGRLAPDASLGAAQAEIALEAHALDVAMPASALRQVAVLPASMLDPEELREGALFMLLILLAGPGIILLVACANTVNLMLVRAVSRRRELAVRQALGATRWRIVRQLLAEGLVIGALAGTAALLATSWTGDLLARFLMDRDAELFAFGPDARMVGFVAGLSVLTPVAFALLPALGAARRDVAGALKLGAAGGPARSRLQRLFVVVQVSLACVLLVISGLLAKTLHRAATTDTGLDLERLGAVNLRLAEAGYDATRGRQFCQDLATWVRLAPGVVDAAFARDVPATGAGLRARIMIEERPLAPKEEPPRVRLNRISAGYFATIGWPIVQGRAFAPAEGERGARLAIVTESAARRFWPGQDPLGKRYRHASTGEPAFYEVVGVVPNTRNRAIVVDEPEFYELAGPNDWLDLQLVLRSTQPAGPVVRAAASEARRREPQLWPEAVALQDHVPTRLRGELRIAVLAAIAGLVALALAASGVFGLMAFIVKQRTAEIGVRIALGATAADVRRLVLRLGLGLAGIGVGCGLLLAAGCSRILTAMLFGVTPLDPPTYALVAALLLIAATLACWLPARRATRVNPIEALRAE